MARHRTTTAEVGAEVVAVAGDEVVAVPGVACTRLGTRRMRHAAAGEVVAVADKVFTTRAEIATRRFRTHDITNNG